MPQIEVPTQERFPRRAEAVVIGGGVVGVATAFWLTRAGLDTVVLERRDGFSTPTTARPAECFRAEFSGRPWQRWPGPAWSSLRASRRAPARGRRPGPAPKRVSVRDQ